MVEGLPLLRADNTSGFLGVRYKPLERQPYKAYHRDNEGRYVHLGYHATAEEAAKAVARKREEEHGGAEAHEVERSGESRKRSAKLPLEALEPPTKRKTRAAAPEAVAPAAAPAAAPKRAAPPAAAPAAAAPVGEPIADDDAAGVEASIRKKKRKPGAKERAKAKRLAQAADAADTCGNTPSNRRLVTTSV